MPLLIGAGVAQTLGRLASGAGARSAIAAGVRGAVGGLQRVAPAIVAGGALGAGAGAGQRLVGFRPGRGFEAQPRRRRARGITAAELRGARKVAALVRMYGMRPKSGRIGKRRCR